MDVIYSRLDSAIIQKEIETNLSIATTGVTINGMGEVIVHTKNVLTTQEKDSLDLYFSNKGFSKKA